jgi:hypothetical protein
MTPFIAPITLLGIGTLQILTFAYAPPIRAETSIQQDLIRQSGRDFGPLVAAWKRRPNPKQTLKELFSIAQDRKSPDHVRYIALQGFAQLAQGTDDSVDLLSLRQLSEDPSWMVRTGTLKALEIVNPKEATPVALILLKDPALVVRMEALRSIETLKLTGKDIENSLLDAAEDPRNWRANQPLHIPERAALLVLQLRRQTTPKKMELRSLLAQLRARN